MVYDIQKLLGSEYEQLKRLGRLLYNRENQDGGLTLEETYQLLKIINDDEMFKIYNEGYNDGFAEDQH
ncbi:hypothetical protein ACDN41_11885 [Priestia aryabhattai]|uniref:hypothetical protein n=1 Tax=Priestia TaxID=2800373 RepID=UPI0035320A93